MGSERDVVCTVAGPRLIVHLGPEVQPAKQRKSSKSLVRFLSWPPYAREPSTRQGLHGISRTMKKFDPASLLVARTAAADEGAIIRMAQKSRDLRASAMTW